MLSPSTNDILHNLFESLTNRMNYSPAALIRRGVHRWARPESLIPNIKPVNAASFRTASFVPRTRRASKQTVLSARVAHERARALVLFEQLRERARQLLVWLSQDLITSREPKCELSSALSSLAFGGARLLLVADRRCCCCRAPARNHATF